MEPKKISFGFSKINKKLNLLPIKENVQKETKVELIKCLEGQEIKLVEEKPEELPLIIPLKESHKTSAALASLIKRRAVLLGEEETEESTEKKYVTAPISNEGPEDIEKRAARELLADVQKNDAATSNNNLVLPVVKPEDLPLDGAKESTLDDYDSIPIQDFGKAMLRGMGWSEPPATKNKKGSLPIDDTPMVRPKGMGLGADKALTKKPLLVAPEANEVLEVKRNAYVRILGGKHKDLYGQIEGFDDHAGRVIVKMAIGGAKEAFNEFLCQPVSKKEYAQYGKCIRTPPKYEEYKRKENEHGQIILDKTRGQRSQKGKNRDEGEHIKRQNDNKRDYPRDDERDRRREYSRDDEKDRRRENNRYDDRDRKRETNRDDKRDHRREYNQDDEKDRKRDYNRDDERERRKEYNRDNERDRRRDYSKDDDSSRIVNDRYRKREDNTDNDRDRRRDKDDGRDRKFDDKSRYKESNDLDYSSSIRDKERQRERERQQHKVIAVDDSSDSENETHTSKHKKSKKSKHAKKKFKKSKSKYKNDSSEEETSSSPSSTDSSTDSEEEKHKKHKKKTKKSKKQRERSRSRGRR
ncbi:G-patch domain and KOW motifs-containing protein [Lucilia sericata]|uniref:G-patch domain and KOW motifs-containing protein n=1 Tax=Lucilia sericata TaxID=13632 RepID=UPI0018A80B86|nr:G-patch domain and KOW motifs-containing protein [Lucilia sericata]